MSSTFHELDYGFEPKQVHPKTQGEMEKREEDLERISSGDFLPRTRVRKRLIR